MYTAALSVVFVPWGLNKEQSETSAVIGERWGSAKA